MARVNLGKVVPEKGVDYYTEAEKIALKQEIENDLSTQINKNKTDIQTLQTESGNSIEMSLDQSTYKLTLKLKNKAGQQISSQTIDLPNENSITDISYNNGKLTLTKQSGTTTEVDITGLINGLVTETDFETFTTALETTLNTIEENIQNNYKVITKLQEDIEDLTERVEDAENNQLTNTPEIATSHYLQDSADARFRKFIPIGRTTQESTTGANLQKFNARETATYNYKCDEKGQVTITGNISSYVSLGYNLSSNPMTLTAGTYKLKVIGKISSNTSILLNGTTGITLDSNQEYTYVLSNDTSSFYIALSVNTGTHDDNFYITLASGTTATTERYTGGEPAPNPKYPFPIKNTGDNVNLFDKAKAIIGAINKSTGEINTSDTLYYSSDFIEIKTNTEYYVNISVFRSDAYGFAFYDSNKNYISGITASNNISVPNNDNIKYLRFCFRNETATNYPTDINIVKLEKGPKATPYSSYGCGNVNEKIQNGNLINIEELLNQNAENVIKNADGSYTFTPKSSSYNTGYSIKVPHNSTYSYKITNGTGTNFRFRFVYDDDYSADGTGSSTGTSEVTISAQPSQIHGNVKEIRFNWTTRGTFTIRELMIEEGSTATSYVPHSEQNISFPLAQGQKFYEGSHPDDDEKVHHKMGEVVLDGSDDEGWETVREHIVRIPFEAKYPTSDNELMNCLCNKFTRVPASATWNNYDYMLSFDKNNRQLIFRNINITGKTDWKAWLAEQYANGTPVKVQYELAEEQTEDFTEEQKTAWEEWKKARTYKNVTHISSEDETPANVEIEYVVDINTIDDRITALEAKVDLLEE